MIETLRKLGFTLYEGKLISYLIKKGEFATAEELAEKTNVPLTKIYSIMLNLKKKGLIGLTPGKPRRYKISLKKFKERLRELEDEKLKEEKRKFEYLLSSLIGKLKYEGVEVKYFTDVEAYWKEYLHEVNKFKKGDTYRVINTVRPTFGLLKEEIEEIPSLKKYAGTEPALKRGTILHYILNPKTIVTRTKLELKDKKKVKKSINQMLERMYKFRRQIKIDIHPAFSNLLLVILKRCVCLEFYDKSSAKLNSALMIYGEQIVFDFANWFDALCKGKHDPDLDFKLFKREIMKYLRWKK